jgi:hypothetical protein
VFRDAVRESYTTLVKEDKPREGGKPRVPIGSEGILPAKLDIRNVSVDVDEVRRAFANNLVRDAEVTAARLAGLRDLHGASFEPRLQGRKKDWAPANE